LSEQLSKKRKTDLGDSLGSLRDGMLGELSREEETGGCLLLRRGDQLQVRR
jgi:hypothetical protein